MAGIILNIANAFMITASILVQMKESSYKSYDELPLFLNAETTAKLLGISISGMYELMHEKGFPVLKIGSRLVVPRDKLLAWVEQNVGK